MNFKIEKASLKDIEKLAVLFDQYRQFYKQPSNREIAKKFLKERIENAQSVIFLATLKDEILAFAQLYPSFSSVKTHLIWILNDLFVAEKFRKQGLAKALLQEIKQFAMATQASKVILCTGKNNLAAQKLYAAEGYELDDQFIHYLLNLENFF